MVALGCKYLRICHLNNCATGVATQDDKLRKNHYHGLPFKVTNYFEFIARETRELMAQLGVTRLVDLIGRTDLLKELDGFTAKQQAGSLSKLLETANRIQVRHSTAPKTTRRLITGPAERAVAARNRLSMSARAKPSGSIFATPTVLSARALSGLYRPDARRSGLAADPIKAYHFNGTAGQSFGVWNAGGSR